MAFFKYLCVICKSMEAPALDHPRKKPPRFFKSIKKVSYGTRRNSAMLYHQYGKIYTTDEYSNVLSETSGISVFKKRNTRESEKLNKRAAKGELEYLAYYQQKTNKIVAWRDNDKLTLRVKGGLYDVNFDLSSQYEIRRLILQLCKLAGFAHAWHDKRHQTIDVYIRKTWQRHKWTDAETKAI